MSTLQKPDPFAIFDIDRQLDVDLADLERRYLKLSRQCHPDRYRGLAQADCVAVLQRAANLNDAFAVLRDPWQRARTLLELQQPGVLERHKQLDPDFLFEALDEAETVAAADAAALPTLRQQVAANVEASFRAIAAALQRGDTADAARRFHQAKYHRKALADLDARLQPEPSP